MKKNLILVLSISLLLLFPVGKCGLNEKTQASPPSATVSLTPASLAVSPAQSFALNLTISNGTDVYLWVATIQWDSAKVNLTSYSEGPFLKQGGSTTFIVGKTDPNELEGLTCSLKGMVPGVSGNGTLATFLFNTTIAGTTSINVVFSDLLDSGGNSIPHSSTNSTVIIFPAGGGGGGKMPYID